MLLGLAASTLFIFFIYTVKIFCHSPKRGYEGNVIVNDEHVVRITPFDTIYVKVGSDKAQKMFPDFYS